MPESPEKKLDRIERLMHELAELTVQITPERYHSDPEEFARTVEAVQRRIHQIETVLATFVTSVHTEYPAVSAWDKIVLTVIALLHGSARETNLLFTLSRAKHKRQKLLEVVPELQNLLDQQRAQIASVQTALEQEIAREQVGLRIAEVHRQDELKKQQDQRIESRQREILRQNERYQELLQQEADADADIISSENVDLIPSKLDEPDDALTATLYKKWINEDTRGLKYIDYSGALRDQLNGIIGGKLASIRKEKARIEQAALDQAREELASPQ